jgi:cystathionine beta-lyase/cystathionine gamma-synthase
LKAAPIDLICGLARSKQSYVVMDNTFAGFHNHHRDDIDIYLHSLTKHANGHSDVLGGIILGPKKLLRKIRHFQTLLGPSLDPHAAYLILRGLKTYDLRYERVCQTAMKVAIWLQNHPKVEQVFYPGLPTHPDHKRFLVQQKDFGGVLMFNLKNKRINLDTILDRCRVFHVLPSIGSTESLIVPATYFYGLDLSPDERQKACIDESSLRLSFGLESAEVLIAELEQLLTLVA